MSSGDEAVFPAEKRPDPALDELGLGGVPRLDVDLVEAAAVVDLAEGVEGQVDLLGVGAVVHRVLELLLQDADDREGDAVDDDLPADGVGRPEQVQGHLPADEGDLAAFGHVVGVEKAAADLRDLGPERGKLRRRAVDGAVDLLAAGRDLEKVVALGHDPADLRDPLLEIGDVLGEESDPPPLGQPFEGQRGLAAVDHDQGVAQAAEADLELGGDAPPESHQQEDRERAPEQGEGDQGGLLPALAVLAPEEAGQGRIHAYFLKASMGSVEAAARAGIMPATTPMASRIRIVAGDDERGSGRGRRRNR